MSEGADVDVSLAVWAVLVVAILGMLAVDLLLHRDSHVVSVREAAVWSGIWVGVAVAAGARARGTNRSGLRWRSCPSR